MIIQEVYNDIITDYQAIKLAYAEHDTPIYEIHDIARLINESVMKYGQDKKSDEYLGLLRSFHKFLWIDIKKYYPHEQRKRHKITPEAGMVLDLVAALEVAVGGNTVKQNFGDENIDIAKIIDDNFTVLNLQLKHYLNITPSDNIDNYGISFGIGLKNIKPQNPENQLQTAVYYSKYANEATKTQYCREIEMLAQMFSDKTFHITKGLGLLDFMLNNYEIQKKVIMSLAPKYDYFPTFTSTNNDFCYTKLKTDDLKEILTDKNILNILVNKITSEESVTTSKNLIFSTLMSALEKIYEIDTTHQILSKLLDCKDLSELTLCYLILSFKPNEDINKKIIPILQQEKNLNKLIQNDSYSLNRLAVILRCQPEYIKHIDNNEILNKKIDSLSIKHVFPDDYSEALTNLWNKLNNKEQMAIMCQYVYFRGISNLASNGNSNLIPFIQSSQTTESLFKINRYTSHDIELEVVLTKLIIDTTGLKLNIPANMVDSFKINDGNSDDFNKMLEAITHRHEIGISVNKEVERD